MTMNQEVSDFIAGVKEGWQVELCHALRRLVHEVIPDVAERMQYRKPHFLKNGKYAAVISHSKDAVSFTIFNTADVELPVDLFDGPPERKTIKFGKGRELDADLLAGALRQASSTL